MGFCSMISPKNDEFPAKTEPNPESGPKIHEEFFLAVQISHRDTEAPVAPTSAVVGSAHNFGRCKNTSCSCTCQSCGHFQQRRRELLALRCFFSVIAAHFLTLSGWLEDLRFFHPPKRLRPTLKNGTKPQPTPGHISWDERAVAKACDAETACFPRLSDAVDGEGGFKRRPLYQKKPNS